MTISTGKSLRTAAKFTELLDEVQAVYQLEYTGTLGSTFEVWCNQHNDGKVRIDIPMTANKRELRAILKPYLKQISWIS